jgi:hypothetical protein
MEHRSAKCFALGGRLVEDALYVSIVPPRCRFLPNRAVLAKESRRKQVTRLMLQTFVRGTLSA